MKVIILRGITGSGKSTYAKENYPNAFVVSSDKYFMNGGVYKFDHTQLGRAHAWCLKCFVALVQYPEDISKTRDIVVDNTNTTAVEIAPYAALALAYGYELEIITLDVPFDTAFERNKHSVPHAVAWAQYVRVMKDASDFPKWWPHKVILM